MPSTATIAGAEVTRYVQSTFKIEAGGVTVWIDPFGVRAAQVGEDRADLVLVTHPHRDHLDPTAIAACRRENTPVVASPAASDNIARTGTQPTSLWEYESTTAAPIEVTAVPGYNGLHPRAKRFNVGFRFQIGEAVFYHAGDTDAVPELESIGPVDVAFLPIGGTFVMDESEAAQAVTMVKANTVVPTHYGFVTGGDPHRFAALVGSSAEVVALDPALRKRMPPPVRLLAKLIGRRRKRW